MNPQDGINLGLPTRSNPQVQTRNALPFLANNCGLTGDGVEVGVQFGNFSERLLKFSQLRRVFSVDPWCHFGETQYVDRGNVAQELQDYRYLQTVTRFIPYGQRSVVMRMTSENAAPHFAPASLDFIYIDANHLYESIKVDLELWWPKLRAGGIFAGHDYLDGFINDSHFGVKRAVNEFVSNHGLQLYVTNASSGWEVEWPSWYLFKNNSIDLSIADPLDQLRLI